MRRKGKKGGESRRSFLIYSFIRSSGMPHEEEGKGKKKKKGNAWLWLHSRKEKKKGERELVFLHFL